MAAVAVVFVVVLRRTSPTFVRLFALAGGVCVCVCVCLCVCVCVLGGRVALRCASGRLGVWRAVVLSRSGCAMAVPMFGGGAHAVTRTAQRS